MTLDGYRAQFEELTNRSMSMPIAGAIVWTVASILSQILEFRTALLLLLFSTGLIFPIAIGISKFRGEALLSNNNPLAKLMGLCTLMINLLWAVHIPLFMYAPQFVPLSLGIGLGLHWVVYSWIIQHPLGIVHAVVRTVLIVLAWFTFPEQRLFAVSAVIVIVYLMTIYQMSIRTLPEHNNQINQGLG